MNKCDRCGKENPAPIHTCSPSQYVVGLETRVRELEAEVAELRDGNEYVLVRELRDRITELEELN